MFIPSIQHNPTSTPMYIIKGAFASVTLYQIRTQEHQGYHKMPHSIYDSFWGRTPT